MTTHSSFELVERATKLDKKAKNNESEAHLQIEENLCPILAENAPQNCKSGDETHSIPVVHSSSEPRQIHGLRWFLLVLSSLCIAFLYALDNTIVANITPAIVNDFNSVDQLPWLSVGFTIGGVSTLLPIAKLYIMFDQRYLFLGSTVLFMAATALCGGAPNMNAEIVGRVLAGAGGTGMYIGVISLISLHTTDPERPVYLSFIGLLWGAGVVLGPAIGGAVELATWRWGFYINLVAGAIILPLFLWLVPHKCLMEGVSFLKTVQKFDWLGATLYMAAFTFLIIAINFGGTTYSWDSATVIILIVLGAIFWTAFLIQQQLQILTDRDFRMFPSHLLIHKETVLLSILTACGSGCAFNTVFYVPLFYQFVRGLTPLETAVKLLPFVFTLVTMIILGGAVLSKAGFYKPFYVIGSLLALIGTVLISSIDESTPDSAIFGYTVLIGIGTGAYLQTAFAVVQVVLEPTEAPNGVNMALVAQLGGLAFALAVAGSIFENLSLIGLGSLLPQLTHAQLASVIAGTGSIMDSLSPEQKVDAVHVVVVAIQKVFTQSYATAALSLLLSLFLSNRKVKVSAAAGGA